MFWLKKGIFFPPTVTTLFSQSKTRWHICCFSNFELLVLIHVITRLLLHTGMIICITSTRRKVVVLIFIIFKNQNLSQFLLEKNMSNFQSSQNFATKQKIPLRFQDSICLLHIYFASFPLDTETTQGTHPLNPPPPPPVANHLWHKTTELEPPISTQKSSPSSDGEKRRRRFSSVALFGVGRFFFRRYFLSQTIQKCGRQRSDILICNDFRGFVFFLLPSIKVICGAEILVSLVVFLRFFWGGNVQTQKSLLPAPTDFMLPEPCQLVEVETYRNSSLVEGNSQKKVGSKTHVDKKKHKKKWKITRDASCFSSLMSTKSCDLQRDEVPRRF